MAQKRYDKKKQVLNKGESQRADGRYMYRYKDLHGNAKCIYNMSLIDLRTEIKAIMRDLDDGIDNAASEKTLVELVRDMINNKAMKRVSTINIYTGNLERYIEPDKIGSMKICNIKPSDIKGFYMRLWKNTGLSQSTIRVLHSVIFQSLESALDDDLIRKNPAKNAMKMFDGDDDRKVKNALTIEQQERLLAFLASNSRYMIYLPTISFMLGTAVRIGELAGLTWENVDLKNKTIEINHQLVYTSVDGKPRQFSVSKPKSKAGTRIIPMTQEVHTALIEQKKIKLLLGTNRDCEIDGLTGFIFTNYAGNPYHVHGFCQLLARIVNRYNEDNPDQEPLPHISCHTLRHTSCTRMAELGMDPRTLQYIMGHSKLEMTMSVYNHVDIERAKTEIEKIERVNACKKASTE